MKLGIFKIFKCIEIKWSGIKFGYEKTKVPLADRGSILTNVLKASTNISIILST